MRLKILTLCLLIITTGCIESQPSQQNISPTETLSAKEKIARSATTPSEPKTASAKYSVDDDKLELLMHKKVNRFRVNNNMEKLEYSKKLSSIAGYKSQDMAQYNYISHENHNGESHDSMRRRHHSTCKSSGQNLLRYAMEGQTVDHSERLDDIDAIASASINALMNSPGHRKNILNPDYDVEGIGVFVDENGTVFVTQEFCGY